MKWSNIIVALLVALVLVAGAKRERVLIKGTTVPPGFTRKEDKLAMACPLSHPFALGDGTYCCKYYLRKADSGFDGGLLLYSDPVEACLNDQVSQLATEPGQKLRTSPLAAKAKAPFASECPEDRPFAFNQGLHCCKYFRKKKDGNANLRCNGGLLLHTDPLVCCHQDDAIKCPSNELLCKDHAKARNYCPARTDFIRANGDKGYKRVGTGEMTFGQAESTCASVSATGLRFKTPGEFTAAKEAFEVSGATGTPATSLRKITGGNCINITCNSQTAWVDGSPTYWTTQMDYSIKRSYQADCFYAHFGKATLFDNWCTNWWFIAFCEVQCHP